MQARVRYPAGWLASFTVATSACFTPVYTVPERVGPVDPVVEFDLEVPSNLEIRQVDFVATEYSTDYEGRYSGAIGGRAFLKVYAVDRTTGDAVLLLYEDIERRKQPVQIVRFRRVDGRHE